MESRHITIYGCEEDEADLFRALSEKYGFELKITGEELSVENVVLSARSPCVSVGHKVGIPASVLKALKAAGVAYLCTRSIGLDHIDMEAAEEAGIIIGNIKYSPDSVADHTIMLILMAVRNAKSLLDSVAEGDFRLRAGRGRELNEMTVGVLGAGRIGKAVMKRLQGFGCRILFYDRARPAQDKGDLQGADMLWPCGSNTPKACSFHELLKNSDILTIHLPLDQTTLHQIGQAEIAQMKKGAFLVNTARGGIVDTAAMLAALENGDLGGAALDVVEGEKEIFYADYREKEIPHPYLPRLLKLKNVILTPHTAYYTTHARYDMVEGTLKNCLDFINKHNSLKKYISL